MCSANDKPKGMAAFLLNSFKRSEQSSDLKLREDELTEEEGLAGSFLPEGLMPSALKGSLLGRINSLLAFAGDYGEQVLSKEGAFEKLVTN